MSTLLHPVRSIKTVRDPEPIRTGDDDDRNQAVWLEGLVAYHTFCAEESATDPIGVHELLSERLGVLARTLHGQMPSGIEVHDEQEGPLPSWWLSEITRRLCGQRPIRQFGSLLARCILDEAALLHPYETAAKRLVVRRLLNLASDAEAFRADDAFVFAGECEAAKATAIGDLLAGGW